MSLPGLYAVVDAEVAAAHGWTLVNLAGAVLDGGARLVQVRAKSLSSAALLDVARQVVALAAPFGAAVVVNDRADLAVLAGASGVHVGHDDLSPAEARAIVGPRAIVGVSTHTPEQIAAAAQAPVSYIAIGPVFETATKRTGYDAVGLAGVRTAAATSREVVAIGGVTLDRVAQVIAAGATSVAVITDLLVGGDPTARTRAFVHAAAAAGAAL